MAYQSKVQLILEGINNTQGAFKEIGSALITLGTQLDRVSRQYERNRERVRDLRNEVKHLRDQLETLQRPADNASNSLSKLAIPAGALYGAYQFFGFLKEGAREVIQYLSDIETATLSIASSFTLSGDFIDGTTGRVLTGMEALHAGQALSKQLINELRVENFKTIATLDQLIYAYQVTLPVALAKGFNVEQVKSFTTAMVQAAGAIGLPFDQIAEETRSLLQGTLNARVSRIGTIMFGDTAAANKMLRGMQGDDLFAFLEKNLKAYADAGEESMNTWKGLISNTKDILLQAGSMMMEPVFDATKAALQELQAEMMTLEDVTDEAGNTIGKKLVFNPEFRQELLAVGETLKTLATAVGKFIQLVYHWRVEIGVLIGLAGLGGLALILTRIILLLRGLAVTLGLATGGISGIVWAIGSLVTAFGFATAGALALQKSIEDIAAIRIGNKLIDDLEKLRTNPTQRNPEYDQSRRELPAEMKKVDEELFKGSEKFAEIFDKASNAYNLPPQLLKAFAKQESNYDPNAVSYDAAGKELAVGILQIIEPTAKGLKELGPNIEARPQARRDPERNIWAGAELADSLYKELATTERFKDTPRTDPEYMRAVAAAFHAGGGAVREVTTNDGVDFSKLGEKTQLHVERVGATLDAFGLKVKEVIEKISVPFDIPREQTPQEAANQVYEMEVTGKRKSEPMYDETGKSIGNKTYMFPEEITRTEKFGPTNITPESMAKLQDIVKSAEGMTVENIKYITNELLTQGVIKSGRYVETEDKDGNKVTKVELDIPDVEVLHQAIQVLYKEPEYKGRGIAISDQNRRQIAQNKETEITNLATSAIESIKTTIDIRQQEFKEYEETVNKGIKSGDIPQTEGEDAIGAARVALAEEIAKFKEDIARITTQKFTDLLAIPELDIDDKNSINTRRIKDTNEAQRDATVARSDARIAVTKEDVRKLTVEQRSAITEAEVNLIRVQTQEKRTQAELEAEIQNKEISSEEILRRQIDSEDRITQAKLNTLRVKLALEDDPDSQAKLRQEILDTEQTLGDTVERRLKTEKALRDDILKQLDKQISGLQAEQNILEGRYSRGEIDTKQYQTEKVRLTTEIYNKKQAQLDAEPAGTEQYLRRRDERDDAQQTMISSKQRLKEIDMTPLEGMAKGYRDVVNEIYNMHDKGVELTRSMAGQMTASLSDGFFAVIKGEADSLEEIFSNMFDNLAKMILDLLAQMAVLNTMKAAGGWFGMGASVAHTGGTIGSTPLQTRRFHSGGMITPTRYHAGGVIHPDPLLVPSYFTLAPKFHSGGMLAPDEVPIIAQTGEGVLSRKGMQNLGKLNADGLSSSSGSSNVEVNVGPIEVAAVSSKPDDKSDAAYRGNELGRLIRSAVLAVLMQEKRPGGLLSNG